MDAVKNGIKYEYNNGLAEGSVNKIKVLKRTMYGRNSFQLLKAKYCSMRNFALVSTKFGKNRLGAYVTIECKLLLQESTIMDDNTKFLNIPDKFPSAVR